MMGLLPLWVLLTWMVFPVLALAAETASIGKLRPWPAETVAAGCDGGSPCAWDRPAWRDGRPVPGRILFVSVGFYGHAMPLLSLAEEIAARGHNVTFATHNCLRPMVDETPGVAFLSAGRMPMHDHHLRSKLRSLSQAGGFWGLLTLLNDVYLPLARPMYRALLSAVQLPPPSPPTASPLSPPASAAAASARNAGAAAGAPPGGTEKEREGEVPGTSYPGQPLPSGGSSSSTSTSTSSDCGGGRGSGGSCCCGRGGASSERGDECLSCSAGAAVASSLGASGEADDAREEGDQQSCCSGSGGGAHGCGGRDDDAGGAAPCCVRDGAASWARPFDLVVLDMGSLGGLDFAQKLGIPYMFNSPSLLFDLSGRHVTATLPAWGTGMARRMSLGDRLQNAISPRALSVFLTPAFIAMNKARREQGLEPFFAQDDVFHGARVLVNTAFGFEYPYGVNPLVEMTGPLLPPRVARALSAKRELAVVGSGNATTAATAAVPGDGDHSPPSGGGGGEDDDPLALPFLIRTWLGGTGALVAPGTAAFEAAAKQTHRAEAAATAATAAAAATPANEEAAVHAAAAGSGSAPATASAVAAGEDPMLPDDNGVIYVNLGRMPQLDKWQLVTILQALSSPSEAMCWGGGGAEDRLGRYRILWVLPKDQREQLLSALLPMPPPPSFRLKVLGGLPHLGILAHPAVKAVVSHCGMGAAQEALLFGKPVLCLPMLADQEDVARRVIDAGAGLGLSGLPTGNISSGDIREAVADIVSDPSYGGSAAVLSGVLRRAGGTLRAADVVEGTLQLGGSSYLHPPELRGPWHEASSTDAYVFLLAGLVLMAVLGYALFAALCYGAILLLRSSARMAVRSVRWLLGLPRRFPRVGCGGGAVGGRQMGWWCAWWRRGDPRGSTPNGGKKNSDNGVLLSPEKAAAAVAAAAEAEAAVAKMMAAAAAAGGGGGGSVGGGGGLWDEVLMTLLGGPGPPDPFPEDSLPELDGPAVDRQHAPGRGGRNGGNGGGDRAVASGGAASGNGHLRSLSGELVMWPTAPNDGRTFDFRGWSTGAANGGSYGNGNGNGNDVAPHHLKRWD